MAAENVGRKREAAAQLQEALSISTDSGSRGLILEGLARVGVDPCAPARRAGCVTAWRLLGPVQWDSQNPIDKKFVDEPNTDPAKTYTINGRQFEWLDYLAANPTGTVDLAMIYGAHDSDAVYAYADVVVPERGRYLLSIGSNDGFKCWFNGKEVGRFDGGRTYAPDQDICRVRARKGINTVLLKVTQMGGGWAFSARLLDSEGNPVDTPQPD
jgi:hypothetical protein